ncbi:hypothetical protein N7470_002557 [Penicillium chermesinum]|nr:hypothetical protein N7470_002557 [Penicillium chermesinum]
MSTPITRLLSHTVNKPYRSKHLRDVTPHLDANGFVAFAPDDIENPQNWSLRRRVIVTMSAVLLVVNATFASSSPSGCFGSISEHFGISTEVAGLTITLFLLGYCAGPLIFAPLSEFYGRRYIFYVTFLCYLAFNFLCAFAPNLGALLVGRFLAGTFVSAPLSNCPGLLADVWNPLQRSNAMAGFSAMTYAPIILYNKAKRIRRNKIPGYENVRAPVEASDRTLLTIYKVALTRPWIILFDPISFLCAIYMSVVYTLLYMLFSIYPIVFQEKRGWNSGVGELPLCGTIVGALLGGGIVVIDTKIRQRRVDRGETKVEDTTPEDRLTLAMIGGILFSATMFWFAWTAEYDSIHWIVPTLAGCFLSSSLLLIFVAYLNYLVDVYLMYAASAIAANTIARSACGAAAPLFTNQMFSAMGIGGGGSLIGGVAALLAVIPFLFYKYGKQIRIRSKFAPTQVRPRAPDVENNPADEPISRSTSSPGSEHGMQGEAEK